MGFRMHGEAVVEELQNPPWWICSSPRNATQSGLTSTTQGGFLDTGVTKRSSNMFTSGAESSGETHISSSRQRLGNAGCNDRVRDRTFLLVSRKLCPDALLQKTTKTTTRHQEQALEHIDARICWLFD